MTQTSPSARTTIRRIRWLLVLGPIVVIAVITATLGYQAPKTSLSSTPSPLKPSSAASPSALPSAHGGPPGEADGILPDGVTVFDDGYPGVTKLDPDLLQALRAAATDAVHEGVKFYVNSGWRSPEYQNQLLREAVSKYGSEEEAARWVAPPAKSLHVSGDAVDLGHSNAMVWLSEHGAKYGLCQIYRNEPWHYELRTDAIGRRCPRMYADATQDPRLQQ